MAIVGRLYLGLPGRCILHDVAAAIAKPGTTAKTPTRIVRVGVFAPMLPIEVFHYGPG